MEEMKKREDLLEKEMAEVLLQNRRLVDPLQRARDEVNELRKKLAHYEQDKALLAVSPPPHAFFQTWAGNLGLLVCSAVLLALGPAAQVRMGFRLTSALPKLSYLLLKPI